MTSAPSRPVLRYHGGKWRLAPWILQHFPTHRVYVEPFGGGGAVLVRKRPASIEVYNDLDGEVVNVFRVLRDPGQAAELAHRLELTPYARTEWLTTFGEDLEGDPVERARRIIVRAFMGHGTKGAVSPQRTGFHTALSDRGRYTRVTSWIRMPAAVAEYTARLRTVLIECTDAVEVVQRFDAPDALIYCDPPYLGHDRQYRCRFSEGDHQRLAEALRGLQGMVIVSGYPDPRIEAMYDGWHRIQKEHVAFSAAPRTEVLWLNPAAAHGLRLPDLFAGGREEVR